jgi:hypothetical protein
LKVINADYLWGVSVVHCIAVVTSNRIMHNYQSLTFKLMVVTTVEY